MTYPTETSRGLTQRPKLTRKRIPVSCIACRVRKLKCNRERPCQNCIARGEGNSDSCVYAEKPEKKQNGQSNPRADGEDMRKRLAKLEDSILSMISSDTEKTPTPSETVELQRINGIQINEVLDYAGGQSISSDSRSTHWNAILNEIGSMKDAFSDGNDTSDILNNLQPTSVKAHRPGLLSGLSPPPDRATIMASIPSKETADKLVLRFFNSYNPQNPAQYVLHKATFLKQYNQHWADPVNTKIIWVGLMFAVLSTAMLSYTQADEVPIEYQGTCPALAELYRIRTAQCLIAADLTRPVPFMLEALMIYTLLDYTKEQDGDMGSWMLSGLMMRMAQQQGYHREPSQHPNLSVFQGEMRRRVWSAVTQHELLFSVQIGLPKSIRYAECDTESPRNLREEELYEEMTLLPPARPLAEDTDVSYQVVKYQVMRALGRVVEFLHLLEPQPYQAVLQLDIVLLETRDLIPPHLLLGSLEEMKTDSPSRIMEKYILQLFWHKAVMLLHRKFWDAHPLDTPKSQWFYSHKMSVVSSLMVLEHQDSMHRAAKPGGCLEHMKWYRFSLTNHDFLLAAMLVALDIIKLQQPEAPVLPVCVMPLVQKLDVIKRSRDIWVEILDDCQDAKRAVRILTSIIDGLSKNMGRTDLSTFEEKEAFTSITKAKPICQPFTNNSYFTDQSGSDSHLAADSQIDYQIQENIMHTLWSCGSDLTMPDFDWVKWDQIIAGQVQVPQAPTPSLLENQLAQNDENSFIQVDKTYPFSDYIRRRSQN